MDIRICSAAMVAIGGDPVTSVLGSSAQAEAIRALYQSTLDELISSYRWRFCSRQVVCQRRTAKPLSVYSAAYRIPEGTNVWSVRVNDHVIDFDRFEKDIYCDAGPADTVVAEVTILPDSSYWPGTFRMVFQHRLSSLFAVTIAEDVEKATLYEKLAARAYAHAKNVDAQTRTTRKLQVGGLRRLHRGRA